MEKRKRILPYHPGTEIKNIRHADCEDDDVYEQLVSKYWLLLRLLQLDFSKLKHSKSIVIH